MSVSNVRVPTRTWSVTVQDPHFRRFERSMLVSLITNSIVLSITAALGVAGYFYLSTGPPAASPPLNYVIKNEREVKPGHGAVRYVGSKPKVQAKNVLEVLERTIKTYGGKNFLGHRPFDSKGKALDFAWETYDQVSKRIKNFAAGLKHENLLELTADGERPLCIYMKNRPEWILAHYAALSLGGFAVALYDTLGADSTQYILNETLASTVVCTTSELEKVINVKKVSKNLKYVVVVDVDEIPEVHLVASKAAGLKVYTIHEVEEIGADFPVTMENPGLQDTYCLIYTSGTTGNPKGVPISHESILATFEAIRERLDVDKGSIVFTPEALHLSYLPLAHCIEHLIHAVIIQSGGAIGYYQGNTLKLTEDLVLLRPTFFVTVPRLLNKIYDKVVNGAKAAGGLKAWLFDLALRTKLENLKRGYRQHALFDRLIFSKVLQKVGLDRCGVVVTGSAPLSDDVTNFFRVLFNCAVHECYGQSETMAAGSATFFSECKPGLVGYPLTSVEIKLVSVPDMGYNVTDTTHGDVPNQIPVEGRGEVCLRGPSVFRGYYKDPVRTAETIDSDGWLHSGDIGVWARDGQLKLVDRKKNIFKLSQGEYVAPEKIENILVTSPYVAQPFVYGDSLHSVLVAIIVPEEEPLMTLAKSLGVSGTFAEVCRNSKVVETVLKELTVVGKNAKLYGFEIVKAIKLHPSAFSVENDLLTPTFKLKRHDAKKTFLDDIDQLYIECGDLVAGQNVRQG